MASTMVQARDVWDADRNGAVSTAALLPPPTARSASLTPVFIPAHEDFQGINVSGYNGNLPWNQDGSGHGSHVAGTIAATTMPWVWWA
jgi:subtilisin family serine protease